MFYLLSVDQSLTANMRIIPVCFQEEERNYSETHESILLKSLLSEKLFEQSQTDLGGQKYPTPTLAIVSHLSVVDWGTEKHS